MIITLVTCFYDFFKLNFVLLIPSYAPDIFSLKVARSLWVLFRLNLVNCGGAVAAALGVSSTLQ